MNAKYIACVDRRLTSERTINLVHIFFVEGTYYEVEANQKEEIDSLTPINVTKLEPRDVILTGELKKYLEGHFLE